MSFPLFLLSNLLCLDNLAPVKVTFNLIRSPMQHTFIENLLYTKHY